MGLELKRIHGPDNPRHITPVNQEEMHMSSRALTRQASHRDAVQFLSSGPWR